MGDPLLTYETEGSGMRLEHAGYTIRIEEVGEDREKPIVKMYRIEMWQGDKLLETRRIRGILKAKKTGRVMLELMG